MYRQKFFEHRSLRRTLVLLIPPTTVDCQLLTAFSKVQVSDTTGDAINTIADKQIIKIINHTLCPGEIN